MRVMRTFLVVALMATAGWMPACAAERVDLLLVLTADISRSVDAVKFQLQRSGYAAAFSNPRVIDAIRGGPSRRIAVTFVELPSLSYSAHTNPPGGLANYYRRNVIGGPGAFVVVAENFNSFGNAIIKKLIMEIAQPVLQQPPSTKRQQSAGTQGPRSTP